MNLTNVNYMFSQQYQSRYLAGYLAGQMMALNTTNSEGSVCFVIYAFDPLCLVDVNGFRYGLDMAGYTKPLLTYTIVSNNLAYEANWIGGEFASMGCTMFSTNIDSVNAQIQLENAGAYVIGNLIDNRLYEVGNAGGDNVLTSSVLSWSAVYADLINHAFNQTLIDKEELDGLEVGATYLAPFSPYVPNSVRKSVAEETARVLVEDPTSYIFKGPVYDNSVPPILKVPPGEVPTMDELYTTDWLAQGIEEVELQLVPPHYNGHELPEGLIIFTYVLVALILMLLVAVAYWVWKQRNHTVIKFAQPPFLITLLVGAAVGLSTIIPLASVTIEVTDEMAYTLGTSGVESLTSHWAGTIHNSLHFSNFTNFG